MMLHVAIGIKVFFWTLLIPLLLERDRRLQVVCQTRQ